MQLIDFQKMDQKNQFYTILQKKKILLHVNIIKKTEGGR